MHGHVYSRVYFLKKSNHYDDLNCYALGIAKPVVGFCFVCIVALRPNSTDKVMAGRSLFLGQA